MASGSRGGDGSGCGAFIALIVVIGLLVAAVISIAALVDPFNWLPSIHDVWAHCDDNYATDRDECALANRFPGFWPHAIANFAYVVAAVVLLCVLAGAVADFRAARTARFAGAKAIERYTQAQQALAVVGSLVAVLAALPIVVAIA